MDPEGRFANKWEEVPTLAVVNRCKQGDLSMTADPPSCWGELS